MLSDTSFSACKITNKFKKFVDFMDFLLAFCLKIPTFIVVIVTRWCQTQN